MQRGKKGVFELIEILKRYMHVHSALTCDFYWKTLAVFIQVVWLLSFQQLRYFTEGANMVLFKVKLFSSVGGSTQSSPFFGLDSWGTPKKPVERSQSGYSLHIFPIQFTDCGLYNGSNLNLSTRLKYGTYCSKDFGLT